MNTSCIKQPQPQEKLSLAELCHKAELPCPQGSEQITVRGVTADSRRVEEGWLFVAVPGRRQNGEDYIPEACRRGAVAVVSQGEPSQLDGVPCVFVENARRALACLCDAWYGHPAEKLRLVGVGGTNGKTSVSCMLAHLLHSAGIPCGIIGTVGCVSPKGVALTASPVESTAHMTTPDPEELYSLLYRMATEADGEDSPVVVMEVTSHALALDKTYPLRYEVGIFTNLSPEHLDFHTSMEDYYQAKRRLFTAVRKAVINADDPYGRRLLADGELSVETYYPCSTESPAVGKDLCEARGNCRRVYAGQIACHGVEGVAYRLVTPNARLRIRCPIPGSFSVKNSMQAVTAALALGAPPYRIQSGMLSFAGVPGRMERIPLPSESGFSAFLDYAHTPDALENLLLTARQLKRRGERVVVLFGCGGDRDPTKRSVMASVASRLADMVIITSDNSRTEDPERIIANIMEGMDKDCPHAVITNRREAIRYAVRHARRGDIILLAGKGHETYELDKDGQHPFCERDIFLAAVKEYHQ